jgi:uncharacterized protein DUF6152
MKRKFSVGTLLVLSIAFVALSALAHHGFQAEFDGSKLIYVKGTLTKFEWENPHMFLYLESTDGNGKVTQWTFEGASPTVVKRTGTYREDLIANVGKAVTVRACPAKDGTNRGAAETIKVTDGRELVVGGKRYYGSEKANEQ